MNIASFFIGYVVPVTVAVALLWVAYRLLFVNSNRFQFNRFFLIGALLFSAVLPFLGLEIGSNAPQIVVLRDSLFPGFTLNEVTITAEGTLPQSSAEIATAVPVTRSFSLWPVLSVLYLIGAAVTAVLFLIKLGRIVALIIRSPKRKMDGYTAVYIHKDQGSFSFFRYAFFPDESVSPDIVRHEMSHMAHGHSRDIIFVELMTILQWFNPFIYLYKRELQSLHEYAADHDVVSAGIDKKNYMMLILQQCTAVDFSSMSNNFSLILTKKRIKMITQHDKAKGFWWKLLATIPVLAVLMLVTVNCQPKDKNALAGANESSDLLAGASWAGSTTFTQEGETYRFDAELKFLTANKGVLIEALSTASETLFDDVAMDFSYTFDGIKGAITPLNHDGTVMGDPNTPPDAFEILPDGTLRYYLDLSDDSGIDHVDLQVKGFTTFAMPADGDVYYIEEMPEFPDGVEAMMKYIVERIEYPEEAYNHGVQGDVSVSFTIDKNGEVTDPRIVHGIGEACDNQVLRALQAMPRWTPGKTDGQAIRVNYTMPVMFRIVYNDEGELLFTQVLMEDEEGHGYKIAKTVTQNGLPMMSVEGDRLSSATDSIYDVVDVMPEYPGGMNGLAEYLSSNIHYPEEAKDQGIQGRVFVRFVVEKDGSVADVEVLRGIGEPCDNEAVRVVRSMPKWTPGMRGGEPVRVRYNLPINFRLQ